MGYKSCVLPFVSYSSCQRVDAYGNKQYWLQGSLIAPAGAPLGSIRTTALMKKPGATNARLACPWSVAETDAPLALYVRSGEVTTIVPEGVSQRTILIASQNGDLGWETEPFIS